MNSHYDFTDNEFETSFENTTFPADLFNHEAHLRLAWVYIHKYGLPIAIEKICSQLKNYVAGIGAADKYNVTLTIASIKIVEHFMSRAAIYNFSDFITRYPELKSNFRGLINKHYAMDIFNSKEAKDLYIAPDLLPFD